MNVKSYIQTESDLSDCSPYRNNAKCALSAHFKKVKILFEDFIEVEVTIFRSEEKNLTCDWFHREALIKINNELRNHPSEMRRVTQLNFEAVPSNIMLDYWLSLPKKSIFLLQDGQTLIAREPQSKHFTSIDDDEDKAISLDDFDILSKIGRGGFSVVYLVRKKSTGEFFAMKQIKKGAIQNPKVEKKLLYAERNNSIALRKPFMVNLRYTFQTEYCFYFVMDYVPGRSLGQILHHRGVFSEEEAKFYIAEIIVGLDIIHKAGFVYRDLKVENILIDEDGHIKFCDFGIAKRVSTKFDLNYTICGTPEVFSPEMVSGKGYNAMADYYSLGILAYELITGSPPFKRIGGDIHQLFQRIMNEEPIFPEEISAEMEDFIQGLLCKDASIRLGAEQGIQEIQSHPWLKGINFEKVAAKMIPPPLEVLELLFEPDLMPVSGALDLLDNFEEQDDAFSTLLFFDFATEENEDKTAAKLIDEPFHAMGRRKTTVPLRNVTSKAEFRKFSSISVTLRSGKSLLSKPSLKQTTTKSPMGIKGDVENCISTGLQSGKNPKKAGCEFVSMENSDLDDDEENQAHLTVSYKLEPKMTMARNNMAFNKKFSQKSDIN